MVGAISADVRWRDKRAVFDVSLRVIRLVHTVAWAFFAGCILAIPVLVWAGGLRNAAICGVIVAVEVAVLLLNGWSCPLTPIAARYTTDRRHNFDIYLPEWLAHHNKVIFGILYVADLLLLLGSWLWRAGRPA